MMTIERIFGPEALQELRFIPLSPLESEIHDLTFSVYGESFTRKQVKHANAKNEKPDRETLERAVDEAFRILGTCNVHYGPSYDEAFRRFQDAVVELRKY